jgi:hypothetical protein
MAEKAAADWREFTERLAKEGCDSSTIDAEQELRELMGEVWPGASALIKSRIKTHWKNATSHSSTSDGGGGSTSAPAPPSPAAPPPPAPPPAPALPAPSSDLEKLTLAALDGMDAKDWAGVRDRLVAALAADDWFVPALLLIRALQQARPSVFQQGDITLEEATGRI